MILELLILLLLLKYKDSIVDLLSWKDYEIPKYAGLDYKPKLRLVVDNEKP